MYGWAVGLTLWTMAGLMLAIVLGKITQARDTQIPLDDTTGDTMANHEWRDVPYDVIQSREEYTTLVDDNGDMLPIVDAFCQGYAEAILFANAYRYDLCPECGPETEEVHGRAALVEHMVQDDDAQYAYHSPDKWWEGMGIDFTDAIDFLAANNVDLQVIATREANKPENRYLAFTTIARTVYEQHGHDFALTRNHHGAGFWDRGYGDVGDRLTDAAQAYGEHSVLTDDGPTVTTL